MQDGYRLIPGFLSAQESSGFKALLDSRQDLFSGVRPKAGMNLPYSVLNGMKVREHLPDLLELASKRLLKAAEDAAGERLELMSDPMRSLRIQRYRAKHEGFKWHLDGGKYSALLTLENTNAGGTEVMSPGWSRILFPFPYFIFFLFQGIFNIARRRLIQGHPGDLLIVNGRRILHRGTTGLDKGERLIFVATFNPLGTGPSPIWDTFARWLNY